MNVLLIYGGKSSEHDISVITACLAKGYFDSPFCAYLDTDNKCYLVDNKLTPREHLTFKKGLQILFPTGEGQFWVVRNNKIIKKVDIDVMVNCCHGVYGEDGSVSAIAKMAGVPLVGSDIASSSIAMDKYLSKVFVKSLGIDVVDGVRVKRGENLNVVYPQIVKPMHLGSSIGVKVVNNDAELKQALDVAFTFDNEVLVERALESFVEFNCAVMRVGGKVVTSFVDVPKSDGKLLSFEDKYLHGEYVKCGKDVTLPVEYETVAKKVKEYSAKIYDELSFSGVVRVDYLFVDGVLYFNEVNSIPGSLAYNLFEKDFSLRQFGSALLSNAIDEYVNEESLSHVFLSDVLCQGKMKK